MTDDRGNSICDRCGGSGQYKGKQCRRCFGHGYYTYVVEPQSEKMVLAIDQIENNFVLEGE